MLWEASCFSVNLLQEPKADRCLDFFLHVYQGFSDLQPLHTGTCHKQNDKDPELILSLQSVRILKDNLMIHRLTAPLSRDTMLTVIRRGKSLHSSYRISWINSAGGKETKLNLLGSWNDICYYQSVLFKSKSMLSFFSILQNQINDPKDTKRFNVF